MPDANAADTLVRLILAWATHLCYRIKKQLLQPAASTLLIGAATDLTRSKADLIAENALLRHQLVRLKRQSKCPRLTPKDRLSLLLLAKITRTWRLSRLIVQLATQLRWHRERFRLIWKRKSRTRHRQSRLSPETITLIRRMAEMNPLWGAERIRGELLKLGIEVAKRTIQRYMRRRPRPQAPSQTWSTFLKTHATDI